jgi:ribosomal protein S12 methylthiotransferase
LARRMKHSNNIYIYVVSLGCDKNRIDTEHMLGVLSSGNAVIVDEPRGADVIIVNTCGFIDEAKQESIDTILEMAALKQAGAKLIVTGCLSQRYVKELSIELPEVDAFLGVASYSRIYDAIQSALEGRKYICCDSIDGELEGRVLTTPGHFAYVRIADGCSNCCSYCAIPQIRGPLKSKSKKSIIREMEDLRKGGVSEAILIAQDTTKYGVDLGGRALEELLREAADVMRGGWLRVLYCYPEGVTDELIDVILKHDSIVKYMDIPIQHFSDSVLRRMNRRNTKESSRRLVKKLHEAGFTLRTSLLVGFPGETEYDFAELLDCVEELKIDRLGVFRYSAEEGTKAAKMPGQVPDEVKRQRCEAVMALQQGISLQLGRERIGQKLPAIVDGIDEETGRYIGRTEGQAPNVDGITYITSKKVLTAGTFHDVLIKDAYEYDFAGETE